MRKLILLFLVLSSMLLLVGCSEKDDNPTTVVTQGYKLDQFINAFAVNDTMNTVFPDTTDTDYRGLYSYEIISSEDGFSPRQSSQAGYDLSWNSFKNGYLVPSDNQRTWFADTSLPGAFKVRQAGYFRLYRTVNVIAPDNSSQAVELRGLPVYDINNWNTTTEAAVKLSDLVQGIAAYDSVSIVCYDDYGNGLYYTPEAINDGYYLLESERTIFPTVSVPSNMRKMKKVAYLQVFGPSSAQNYSFENAPTTSADMIFSVPASLSSFTGTDLPDYPN